MKKRESKAGDEIAKRERAESNHARGRSGRFGTAMAEAPAPGMDEPRTSGPGQTPGRNPAGAETMPGLIHEAGGVQPGSAAQPCPPLLAAGPRAGRMRPSMRREQGPAHVNGNQDRRPVPKRGMPAAGPNREASSIGLPLGDIMARKSSQVTRKRAVRRWLPEFLNEGLLHLAYLRDNNWLPIIAEVMQLGGWRGNEPFDIFLFMYACITANIGGGFDRFYKRILPVRETLAAALGRNRIVSDSSAFRYCQRATLDLAERVGLRLVLESAAQGLLRLGGAATVKDATGRPYYFLDVDFTLDAFRLRSLVTDPRYTKPKRRILDITAAGRAGRKRGERVLSRGLLYLAGSSHFLATWIFPGNGDFFDLIGRAIDRMGRLAKRTGIPRDQFVFRMDGEGGNGRVMGRILAAGYHVLTRIARYELLTQPSFQRCLNEAAWYVAPLSEEGLTRYAADAGEIVMPTNSPDCPDIPSEIKLRLIVTRFRSQGKNHRVGCRSGEWIFEMFATELPADGWHAVELVQQYFERGGAVENSISMQKKETGLGYLFTEDPESLLMVNNIGLFVWNNRLNMGRLQKGSPEPEPRREPRRIEQADGLPIPFPPAASPHPSVPDPQRVLSAATAPERPNADANAESMAAAETRETGGESTLLDLLGQLEPPHGLQRDSAVKWSAEQRLFLCSAGQKLTLHGFRARKCGFYAVFRIMQRVCGRCLKKADCTSATSPAYVKEVAVPISEAQYVEFRRAFDDPNRPAPSRSRHCPIDQEAKPGPFRLTPSSSFPREARKIIEDLCAQTQVTVTIPPSCAPPANPTIDEIYQKRRRRRLTKKARFSKNQLDGTAIVNFHVPDGCQLAPLIPRGGSPKRMPYDLPVNVRFKVTSLNGRKMVVT